MTETDPVERRRWAWATTIAIALGALVRAPLLGAGFVSDDYVLLAGIEHRSTLGNPASDLWSFYDGVPAHNLDLVHAGGLPWWTAPTASHAFFRPLASLVLVGAHALFRDHAIGYYALLLAIALWNGAIAARIFRRLMPAPAAAFGVMIFTLHALNFGTTCWISAIHIPLATALVLTGCWWQLRFRLDGWRAGQFLSVVAFAAALFAGEAALCALAFVFVHSLVPRRKISLLAPPIALAALYVVFYRARHFGAHAIDGYLDPGEHPARFVRTFVARSLDRLPELVLAPADSIVVAAILALAIAFAGVLVFRFDRAAFHAIGIWTLATILAALPAFLGPTDRALFPATFGSAAALGLLAASCWRIARARERAAARLVCALIVSVIMVAHIGGGARANFEAARAMRTTSEHQRNTVEHLALATPAARDVVVLTAEDQATGPWGGLVSSFATGERPRSWQALSLSPTPHTLGRLDAQTIELALVDRAPFPMHLYRNADDHPMRVGERVRTPRLSIEVMDVDRGRPSRIRVHADTSLDDASIVFAARSEAGLTRVAMPPIGMGTILP